jgi:GxxExxY protein
VGERMNLQGSKAPRKEIPKELDLIGKAIVDATFKVHVARGPGLMENVYEICLAHEIRKRGIAVDRQIVLPVLYDGIAMEAGMRFDLLVDGKIIVEVKAVEQIVPVHKAQILTYLKLTHRRLGYLINFNEHVIREGIHRLVL